MPPDPLASLKDIHLPSPVTAWPPAPGWIIGFVLLTFLLCALVYTLYRRHQLARPKQQALLLLERYAKETPIEAACAKINILLKQLCLLYYPREDVAELHGQAWIDFLNQSAKHVDFNEVADALIRLPYQKPALHQDNPLPQLLLLTRAWLKQQKRPPCYT